MNEREIRDAVLSNLAAVAPEVDPAALKPDQPLRNQVDLDSYDWLRFLVALHEQLKVEIPEADYQKLTTLDRLISYLKEKTA